MKKKAKIACIYKITNVVNNKIYVGSSTNYERRIKYHTQYSGSGCIVLKRAFDKYGLDKFKWEILRILDIGNKSKAQLRKIIEENEQEFLDKLLFAQEFIKGESKKFLELGYNLQPIAYSSAKRKESNVAHKFTRVVAYSSDGSFYKEFESMQIAAKETGDKYQSVVQCCNNFGNVSSRKRRYIWRHWTINFPSSIVVENLTSKFHWRNKNDRNNLH